MKNMKHGLRLALVLIALIGAMTIAVFASVDPLQGPRITSFDEDTLTLTWTEPDNPDSPDFQQSWTLMDGKHNSDYLGWYVVRIYYAAEPVELEDRVYFSAPEGLEFVASRRIGERGDPQGTLESGDFSRGEGYYYFTIQAMTTQGELVPWEGHEGFVCAASEHYYFYGPYYYVPAAQPEAGRQIKVGNSAIT